MFFEKIGRFRNSSDGGYRVTRLLKQPNKLMTKLDLSVDDQNMCYTALTVYMLGSSKTVADHHLGLSSPNDTSND
jgi:hypothetical protein